MSVNELSKDALTRRTAIAAGLAPLLVPRHVLGGAGYRAPSDKLTIACVGVGGMGRNYLEGCKDEQIVALCDLDFEFSARYSRPTRAPRPTGISGKCSTRSKRTSMP